MKTKGSTSFAYVTLDSLNNLLNKNMVIPVKKSFALSLGLYDLTKTEIPSLSPLEEEKENKIEINTLQ